MAEIQSNKTVPGNGDNDIKDVIVVTWEALDTNGDTGAPVMFPNFPDRTVEVRGTFGTGGEITIEGRIGSSGYYTLNDIFGNPLVFTSAGLAAIAELVTEIRPRMSAGTGTIDLDIIMIAKR